MTPFTEEPPKYPCNLVQVYILFMHRLAAFMLFMHGSRKVLSSPRRSLVGGITRNGWGASKVVASQGSASPRSCAERKRQGMAKVQQETG